MAFILDKPSMTMTTQVPTLNMLLEKSKATAEFALAVRSVAATGRPCDRIRFSLSLPPVKILRTLCQLLESEPDLVIEAVAIEAVSGCSNFTGTLDVNGGVRRYAFDWDCRWRAEQLGWRDMFGLPDQARAAREFGYRCFRRFERLI